MSCCNSEADIELCNKIMNEAENLILERGILSFRHTEIITKHTCSARLFYKNFANKEDILVCTLLRRSMTYDIERFLSDNTSLSEKLKIFVPSLISFEVSRNDPMYIKTCLIANNTGIWQLVSEHRAKLLKVIDERYYACVVNVSNLAISSGALLDEDKCQTLIDDLYYYCLGRLASIPLIITKHRPLKRIRDDELQGLLYLSSHYNWKEAITLTELQSLQELVKQYCYKSREVIDCNRCQYFNLY